MDSINVKNKEYKIKTVKIIKKLTNGKVMLNTNSNQDRGQIK